MMNGVALWQLFGGRCIQDFDGENVKERYHLEGLGVDGNKILKYMLKDRDCKTWAGLNWLRIGTTGGLL
jgi:hypothetical protein